MRNKILMTVLAMALSALMAGAAFAEDVYVTKYGKKYHKADSRFIKGKETTKMTREEAEEKGYKPSSDFLTQDEVGVAVPADSAQEG